MTTSLHPRIESGPVDGFVSQLRCLTITQLTMVASHVGDARASAADNVEWWMATASVSRDLCRLRRRRMAAIAFREASEAVRSVPGACELPHDEIVHVARAAGELARALVAGRPRSAVAFLTRGWEEFLAAD